MALVIQDKKKCSGCYACVNACPKKCIEMREDECGFQYPFIHSSLCVDCHVCEKICPISGEQVTYNSPLKLYAAWSDDSELRYTSTSGGLFSELALAIIHKNGCAVGAAYGKENVIEHIIVDTEESLSKVRQSKYAQSNINQVYTEVKERLKKQQVLFCGTPCQVAGLIKFLGKTSDNLITVDFICRGVNSPKALRSWVSEIEKVNGAKVRRIWFKYKEDGWHKSPKCTRVDLDNGTMSVFKGKENAFMHGYLGPNLYIRPSCSDCIFKGQKRVSDITLGDFWGIAGELDDNNGTSLVILNTEKGIALFESIQKRIQYSERELSEINEGNVCFSNSVNINPKSVEFLSRLNDTNFSSLVYQYAEVPLLRKVIFRIKRVVKRLTKRG